MTEAEERRGRGRNREHCKGSAGRRKPWCPQAKRRDCLQNREGSADKGHEEDPKEKAEN